MGVCVGKLGSIPLGPCQILLPVSIAFMKVVEELEMCQMGKKKNDFAWKANLGTTLSVEPTQTERCSVRTVQGP